MAATRVRIIDAGSSITVGSSDFNFDLLHHLVVFYPVFGNGHVHHVISLNRNDVLVPEIFKEHLTNHTNVLNWSLFVVGKDF